MAKYIFTRMSDGNTLIKILDSQLDIEHEEFKNIVIEGQKIGKVGLSFYEDIKAVGLGSLEIFPKFRNKGYGTKVIENIVEQYKGNYDLIYCYVDKTNAGAIRLYEHLGKVFRDITNEDETQYYVEFYRR